MRKYQLEYGLVKKIRLKDRQDLPKHQIFTTVQVLKPLTPQLKSLRAFVTTAEAAAKLAASTKDAEGVAQQQTIDYTLTIRSTWKNDAQNANVVFNDKLIVSDKPNNNYNNTEHGEYAVNMIENGLFATNWGVGNLHILQPIKTICI